MYDYPHANLPKVQGERITTSSKYVLLESNLYYIKIMSTEAR